MAAEPQSTQRTEKYKRRSMNYLAAGEYTGGKVS